MSTTGNDANDGLSQAQSLATIQEAIDRALIGSGTDIINVLSGSYSEEITVIAADGITILSYDGAGLAILDRGGVTTAISELKMITVLDSDHISIDGLRITNRYGFDEPSLVGAKGIEVSGNCSGITLQNCTLDNIGWDADATADPVINSIARQAHGILVYAGSGDAVTNVLIKGITLHDLVTGNSEALTVGGKVSNFRIDGNIIYDITNIGIDVAGGFSWIPDQASDEDVINNTVYNCKRPTSVSGVDEPAGIYVDGGKDILVYSNRSYQNGQGFSVGAEIGGVSTDNITVINNIAYENNENGIVFGVNAGTVTNSILRNNTFYNNGAASYVIDEASRKAGINVQKTTGSTIENNLVYETRDYLNGISQYFAAPYPTTQYNWVYGTDATFGGVVNTGNANGINDSVSFDNLLDLTLPNGSPGINAGNSSTSLTTSYFYNTESLGELDFDGDSRLFAGIIDIGADENADTLASLIVTDNATDLILTIYGSNIVSTYDAFIDLDNDLGTGYLGGDVNGAEFYISAGTMYAYNGTTQAWGWDTGSPFSVIVNDATGLREIVIDKTDLSLTTSGTTINANYANTGTASDKLPTSGMESYVTTTAYAPNLSSIAVSDDATLLTVVVSGNVLETNYALFLDTDNNSTTGYLYGDVAGADYFVSGGSIYSYSGVGQAWGWTITSGVTVTDGTGTRTFEVSKTTIGSTSTGETVNALYQNQDAGFNTTDVLPTSGMESYATTVDMHIGVIAISISQEFISLTSIGVSEQLTAVIDPLDASDQSLHWSSSDESIVTVSEGGYGDWSELWGSHNLRDDK